MRREDCIEMFERIPVRFHPQINVVMQNQAVISVDMAFRFEPNFLVLRGREAGSTDEGRAFFLPYEEISYVRLERTIKMSELKSMFGETGHVDEEDRLAQHISEEEVASATVETSEESLLDAETPPPSPSPLLTQDPASIAKQNLLDRIRAARANATGKLGNKPKSG
jgi:hypothetical protein